MMSTSGSSSGSANGSPKTKETAPRRTRIQERNRAKILSGALESFSSAGCAATSVETIAAKAGMSKQNLLYYFPNKEALYLELLSSQMDNWHNALSMIDPHGDPVEEICRYAERKVDNGYSNPMQCRLFAMELLTGAEHFYQIVREPTRQQIMNAIGTLAQWMSERKLRQHDPAQLLFSVWAMTEQYANYGIQMCKLMDVEDGYDKMVADGRAFIRQFLESALRP